MNGKRITIGILIFIFISLGVWWFMLPPKKKGHQIPAVVVGVGLYLGRNDDTHKFELRKVFPNSPAAKAGLVPGQILSRVDGNEAETNNIRGLSMLLTGPIGSKVTLEMIDTNGVTNMVELTRAKFSNNSAPK